MNASRALNQLHHEPLVRSPVEKNVVHSQWWAKERCESGLVGLVDDHSPQGFEKKCPVGGNSSLCDLKVHGGPRGVALNVAEYPLGLAVMPKECERRQAKELLVGVALAT
jgi:hypothetical protein